MNLLFIASRLPLPADTGGKIRTYNLLMQLAKTATIHLVCFSFYPEDKEFASNLIDQGIQVSMVPIQEPLIFIKLFRGLFDYLPVSVSKYYSRQMESVLTELNETNRFDAIHIDHVHMAHYIPCFKGVYSLIDEHNVEYKILERCANVEKSPFKRFVFRNQAEKMKSFEEASLQRADAFCAVSENDKSILDQFNLKNRLGYVIPNGVDTVYFDGPLATGNGQEDAVVFTGSMDWFPNVDCAEYFIKDILPLIRKKRPGVKLYIVGKNPPQILTDLAGKDEGIILTGRVDDVRPFVRKSKIFVVPLRIGGGTRLKILEAMSMQKAVVSTTIGAEGIDYTEDKDIVLADKPEEFAQKVLTLLDDEDKRKDLGIAGRQLVKKQYDWDIVGGQLTDIYEKIS